LTILTPRPARKLADADAWQRLMVKDGQGDAIQPAFANENWGKQPITRTINK
jgi:hypothetical protein